MSGRRLSPRGREVLLLRAAGVRDDVIGERLGITRAGVRSRMQYVRVTMRAHTTAHALALALAVGMITLEEVWLAAAPVDRP